MEKIMALLRDIASLKDSNTKEKELPNNVFYLNGNDILCMERTDGASRYPYDVDGLNLWIYSNGYITSNESNMVIFRTPYCGDEPCVEFWGGVRNGEEWIPVSITGVTTPVYEHFDVKRYTVYCPREAYFIAEAEEFVFAVRACVTDDKKIHFTTYAVNKLPGEREMYIAAYISPTLRYTNDDNEWAPYMRIPRMYGDSICKITRFSNPEDNDITNIAVIKATAASDIPFTVEKTVSKNTFLEGGRGIYSAKTLRYGRFLRDIDSVNTIDMPIYSSINKFTIKNSGNFIMDFSIRVVHDDTSADFLIKENPDFESVYADLLSQENKLSDSLGNFNIHFSTLKNANLNNELFNKFLRSVRRQVSLCAFGKNYAANMLGMRDVYQQLNAAIAWNGKESREKMLRAINYIMADGRVPRQISIPDVKGVIPEFDIRLYIDQGFWIIETYYKYLSYTGDLSILDEVCSYYEIIDEKKKLYKKSDAEDTALEHLIKITDFLISNIDEETGCLKILYGDWNDAVCGLGRTEDDAEFGNGVSVMATLQLYKMLKEMSEILSLKDGYVHKRREYETIREDIAEALCNHALQNDNGRIHILHGWGDKRSYNVGSLSDTDGKKRYSSNPYSFWCISGMIERDISMKASVLSAYDVLNSKYGIKTFEPYFPRDMKGVGRITTLTPGTAENACAYVHATTFAVMALFILGESERAWEQIYKIIPITHKSVNKTPFVMPNSYCCNEELNIDGESLGDWYTGSGAVVTRCIFEYAIGITADLGGMRISVPSYMPSDRISLNFSAKGKNIEFLYENKNSQGRKYYINGILAETQTDSISGIKYIYIDNASVIDNLEIVVVD